MHLRRDHDPPSSPTSESTLNNILTPIMMALLSPFLGYLPLTLLLLLILLATRSHTHLNRSIQKSKSSGLLSLPQSIPSTVPIIGHLLSYVKDGPTYFSRLWYAVSIIRVQCNSLTQFNSSKTDLPVFRIDIATVKISLIQPKLTRFLPRLKNVSLNPLVLDMFRQSLGLGRFSSKLLEERDDTSRQFGPHASRMFRQEFIPNLRLGKYVEIVDNSIRQDM